ncbi:hypothetical protein PWT90_04834 [Aphanocladium album]|nr:hypothetical protein PWT90_04834 [Aphanocladium album]
MASHPTPLELTDTRIMLILGHVLWSWPLCEHCIARRLCSDDECGARVGSTQRYFQFYKALIDTYVDEGFEATRAFKTHEDLFAALQALRTTPNMTRKKLADVISGDRDVTANAIPPAVSLTVKVLTMIDSSSARLFSSPGTLEMGRFRTPWREYVPFCDYVDDLFPQNAHSSIGEGGSDKFADIKSALRASKLKKKLRLTLRLTHDLRDHLQFDRKHKILDIFHMTTFLKEQLRHSKEVRAASSDVNTDTHTDADTQSSAADTHDVLLPRQLLLETLASIQQILFPPSDRRSRHLLRTLIASAGFDPDAARYESATVRQRGETTTLRYVYLAERLEDLYEETLNPPPDGWLDRVLERKRGKRHVMCITIAGFVVALLLGVLSLVAGVFQAVIAYLAWKNP